MIHPGPGRVGSLRAERRDRPHDDPRIARRELLVLEAEIGGQAGTHVGQHDVRAAEQRVEDAARVGMTEVEWQRVLAAIADQEVPALAAAERRDVTARLALQRLDLDHVRAAVGEHLPGPRHGDEVTELQNGDAGERLFAHAYHASASAIRRLCQRGSPRCAKSVRDICVWATRPYSMRLPWPAWTSCAALHASR